jgi:pimeloyl-ACP methyl ester carboxylesterase
MCPDEAATRTAGVRLVTIDRPGYGRSDPRPEPTVLDWIDDYAELSTLLRLPPCPIVGTSNGGPYAMACAARLPDRVTMIGLAATLAPLDELPSLWDELPPDMRDLIMRLRQDPGGAAEDVARRLAWYATDPVRRPPSLPPGHPDDLAMRKPGVFAAFARGHREGARQGVTGFVADFSALNLPWGFSLAEIQCPARIWWGDEDPIMSRTETEYVARTIPRSTLTIYPGEGHAITFTHWAEMLDALRQPIGRWVANSGRSTRASSRAW